MVSTAPTSVDHKFHVLCVNVDPDQLAFSGQISEPPAQMTPVVTIEDAFHIAENEDTPVVVCREDAPGGGWQTLLQKLQTLTSPPTVIVYCTRQDAGTWSQVLNCGGFDVLWPSTSPDSAMRTIQAAYERRVRQLEVAAARKRCARVLSDSLVQRYA